MTQEDMNAELAEATRELGSNFETDRCRHETIATTTIWVFQRISAPKTRGREAVPSRGSQVAVIARREPHEITDYRGAWRVSLMRNGGPVSQHFTNRLGAACAYVRENHR